MSVRVRFAPSPTGFLHVGGARTALYNYLFARASGGVFVLRIEDTDAERSSEASVDAILAGLRWLGLAWDEGPGVGGAYGPYLQSERGALYDRYAAELLAREQAYRCWCTADELESRRAAQAARGEAPRYDGHCRSLSADERRAKLGSGAPFALRFALPASGEIAWDDVVRGRIAFAIDVLDDFVIVRSDGLPTYNFACVVDDLEMAITHVVRGDDHISNTPRQLLIYAALGSTPPLFAHASMILGPDGKRLSKRHGATSVEAFGELGIIPEGMVNFLVLLGWSLDGQQELFTLPQLEQHFDLARIVPSPAVFNVEKLEWINGQQLKALSVTERARRVAAFLRARGVAVDRHPAAWWEAFVSMLGERLKTLLDAETYGRFALTEQVTIEPDAWEQVRERDQAGVKLERLAQAIAADPDGTLASLEAATRACASALGIKAGELIGLARVAITGRTVAPGIFEAMALLGRERTIARLREAAARWAAEPARG